MPTWNYAAVHARGTAVTFTDPRRLRAHVSTLTNRFETDQAAPWTVDDAPHDFIAGMLRAIIGVEITLTEVTGRWKCSKIRRPPTELALSPDCATPGRRRSPMRWKERARDISHPKGE